MGCWVRRVLCELVNPQPPRTPTTTNISLVSDARQRKQLVWWVGGWVRDVRGQLAYRVRLDDVQDKLAMRRGGRRKNQVGIN